MEQTKSTKLISKNFLIIFTINVLFASCFSLLNIVIPFWLSEYYGADSGDIGVILGLSVVSTIIFRPFMGYAVDRWGRKKILYISILIFGLLNFCFLFANNMWIVLLIRFIQAIPFAAFTIAIVTLGTDTIPEERIGEGYSMITAANTIPMAIGSTLALYLYNISCKLPFIVAGSVGLFSLMIAFLVKIPDHKSNENKLSLKNMFSKKLIFFTIVAAISCSVMPGLLSYLSLYAQEISFDLDMLGVIISCFAVTVFIVRMFGAKLLNRLDPKVSGSLSIVLLCIGVFIVGVWKQVVGIAIGAVLLGVGWGTIFPTLLMMAVKVAPENRGVSNSMVFGGLDIAISSGSFLFGNIAEFINSYGNTYLIFAAYEVVGLLIFLLFAFPQYQKHTQTY